MLRFGAVVHWNSRVWVVEDLEDLSTIRLRLQSGTLIRRVPVHEIALEAAPENRALAPSASDEVWNRAQKIFDAIKLLIGMKRRSRADIQAAAQKLSCSEITIYKHLDTWEKSRRVSAFIRKPRSDKGKSRLDSQVQKTIDEVVETYYKREERPEISETHQQIREACYVKGLPLPSLSPVRAAIDRLPLKEKVEARYGAKLARERLTPYLGQFPGAEFPQAVYQIDHTPIDIILVDETDRRSIGRATLTIVIDVCTRMIAGFSVSLHAPSTLSTALALSHAILPKEEWIREHDIHDPGLGDRKVKIEWPIWGPPQKIHVDNAKEFRGSGLLRGCQEHGVTLENRPKGQPQYGGTVERAFGQFMRVTHRLKGTTFSNVAMKGNYDSSAKATMTIAEYEHWFGIYVVYRYHHQRHRGIGYPPINLYRKLVLGTDTTPPIGLPAPIGDARRLLCDFLPFELRTVQQYGVELNRIPYWDDVLRRWVRAPDPINPKKGRKFIFAYDPRNLSTVYFFDPDLNQYLPIPYRNRARPPISLWELQRELMEQANDPWRKTNEDAIFLGINQQRALEEEAQEKTTSARRKVALRRSSEKRHLQDKKKEAVKAAAIAYSSASGGTSAENDDETGPVVAPDFDDI